MKRVNQAASLFVKKKRMAIALFCLACGMAACHEPKLVEPSNQGAAHAEHYAFDLVTLSEWAGHILPSETSFNLLISKDNYYLTQYFSASKPANCADEGYIKDYLEIDSNAIPKLKHALPEELVGKAGEPEISFRVVQYGGEDNVVHCTLLDAYALQPQSALKCNDEQANILSSIIYQFENGKVCDPEDPECGGGDPPCDPEDPECGGGDPPCDPEDPECGGGDQPCDPEDPECGGGDPPCDPEDPECGAMGAPLPCDPDDPDNPEGCETDDPEPDDPEPDDPEPNDPGDPVLFNYECTYASGGALSLNTVWSSDAISKETPTIRLANGDSFGISAKIASYFDDQLVPLFLNAIHLTADVLGNHNFDKTLNYLNSLIEKSAYPYILTNLMNVTKVLPQVSPYAIYEIPAEDKTSAPLRVALIGAIDKSAIEKVFPGRFGSIAVNNYCPVIQAIEKAYNQNARLFFVTAHVSTDQPSLPQLLNALFSFKDGKYLENCESLLEVPQERLPKEYVTSGLMDYDKNVDPYASILAEMRNEIFHGIIGVFGEGTTESKLIPFYYNENRTEFCTDSEKCCNMNNPSEMPLPFCKGSENIKFNDYFSSSNYFTQKPFYEESDFCSMNLGSTFPCYSYAFNEKDSPDHIIYFMQFESQSKFTGHLKVEADRMPSEVSNDSIFASPYRANVTQFDLIPVVSQIEHRMEFEDPNVGTNSIDLITPTPTSCKQYLTLLLDDQEERKACHELYERVLYGSNTDKFIYDQYSTCYAYHNERAKKSAVYDQEFVDRLTATWTCLYHYMDTTVCLDEESEETFFDFPLFSFSEDQIVGSNHESDRLQTSFRANIMSNALLNYVNASKLVKTQNKQDDIPILFSTLNVGAIRNNEDDSLNASGTITKTWLTTTSPYNNQIAVLSFNGSDIAKSLEFLLPNSTGSFPALAGISLSYTEAKSTVNEKNNVAIIHEIWATDRYGALIRPIFVRVEENNKELKPTCGDRCVFGNYNFTKSGDNTFTLGVKLRKGVLYKLDNYNDSCYVSESDECPTRDFGSYFFTTKTYKYKEKINDHEDKDVESTFSSLTPINENGNGPLTMYLVTNEYFGGHTYFVSTSMDTKQYSFSQETYYINSAVAEYYSPDHFETDSDIYTYFDRDASEETTFCSDLTQMATTYDQMDRQAVACMLNVNHLFFIGSSESPEPFSRWVLNGNMDQNAYRQVIDTLNLMCTPEYLNALSDDPYIPPDGGGDDPIGGDEPVG